MKMHFWLTSVPEFFANRVLTEAQYGKWHEFRYNREHKARIKKLSQSKHSKDVAIGNLGEFYLQRSEGLHHNSASSDEELTEPRGSISEAGLEPSAKAGKTTVPGFTFDKFSVKLPPCPTLDVVTAHTTASSIIISPDTRIPPHYFECYREVPRVSSKSSVAELLGDGALEEIYIRHEEERAAKKFPKESNEVLEAWKIIQGRSIVSAGTPKKDDTSERSKSCPDSLTGTGHYRTAKSLCRSKSLELNLERLGDVCEITSKLLTHDLSLENPTLPGHDDITYRELLEMRQTKISPSTINPGLSQPYEVTKTDVGLKIQKGFPFAPGPLPSHLDPVADGINPSLRLLCWADHEPYYHRQYLTHHLGPAAFKIEMNVSRSSKYRKNRPFDYMNCHPQYRNSGVFGKNNCNASFSRQNPEVQHGQQNPENRYLGLPRSIPVPEKKDETKPPQPALVPLYNTEATISADAATFEVGSCAIAASSPDGANAEVPWVAPPARTCTNPPAGGKVWDLNSVKHPCYLRSLPKVLEKTMQHKMCTASKARSMTSCKSNAAKKGKEISLATRREVRKPILAAIMDDNDSDFEDVDDNEALYAPETTGKPIEEIKDTVHGQNSQSRTSEIPKIKIVDTDAIEKAGDYKPDNVETRVTAAQEGSRSIGSGTPKTSITQENETEQVCVFLVSNPSTVAQKDNETLYKPITPCHTPQKHTASPKSSCLRKIGSDDKKTEKHKRKPSVNFACPLVTEFMVLYGGGRVEVVEAV